MKETTHNKNKRKTFSFRRRERTLYFMTLVALLAAGAFGYLLVPTSGTISAQSGGRYVQDLITIEPTQKSELATPDMIEDALNARNSQTGFSAAQWGALSDTLVPGDYDGDGKTDIAVFRDGTWYLQKSQLGFTGVAFGADTDKPVPSAFVP